MIQPAHRSQAIIADFDSLEQLRLWFLHGPQEAIRQYVGYLRLGLLAADRVYIDRAQLLDGVVFLALGPRGLARALGLGSHDSLPLVVGGQSPPTVLRRDTTAEPAALSLQLRINPSLRHEWVNEQLAAIQRTGFVSAAEYAWESTVQRFEVEAITFPQPQNGENASIPERDTRLAIEMLYGRLLPTPQEVNDQWEYFSSPYVSLPRLLAPDFIDNARQEWVTAMEEGRVTLTQWPSLDTKGWPLWEGYFPTVDETTQQSTPTLPIDEAKQLKDKIVGQIAQRVFEVHNAAQENDKSAQPSAQHSTSKETRKGSPGSIATRSDLVLFLAAQSADSLARGAEQIPAHNAESPLFAGVDHDAALMHARACIRWWSKRQYEALFAQNDPFPGEAFSLRRLNFNVTELVVTPSAAPRTPNRLRHEVERAWGLSEPPPSRWQRLLRNALPRSERFHQRDEVHIEGNILDELCVMDAHYYRLLRANPLVQTSAQPAEQSNPSNPNSYRSRTRPTEERASIAPSTETGQPSAGRNRAYYGQPHTAEDWRNIALAVKDIQQEPRSWKKRTFRGIIRALLLFVAALIMTAGDAGVLHSWGVWAIWGIPTIALLSSLPWGEFKELWDLRPGAMSTTVEVAREKQGEDRAAL